MTLYPLSKKPILPLPPKKWGNLSPSEDNQGISPSKRLLWQFFCGGGFLVSVPVFIQAPLVRLFPLYSLVFTVAWVIVGYKLYQRPKTELWGDLLIGFSGSWFCGALYWGWFRYEPLWHLPIEALFLPFTLWSLKRGWGLIGNWFYLGSLLGTSITDVYFYLTGLIPVWRDLIQVDTALILPILQRAIHEIYSPWGVSWAVVLICFLLGWGVWGLFSQQLHHRVFAGTILFTLLVDGLFGGTAIFASQFFQF